MAKYESPKRITVSNSNAFMNNLLVSSKRCKEIVLDMKKTTYISSSGIRGLYSIDWSMKNRGGKGILMQNVNKTILEVLDVTGFIDSFKIV